MESTFLKPADSNGVTSVLVLERLHPASEESDVRWEWSGFEEGRGTGRTILSLSLACKWA